jgi:hypothetical protein
MSEIGKIPDLVEKWRRLIPGKEASWVLFEHGTCVMIKETEMDLEGQAKEILAKWGPIVPGTELGDFNVIKLEEDPGWVVTYTHPTIFNYVGPDEIEGDESLDKIQQDVTIGCTGRARRQEDAKALKIIHVENKSA